MVARKKCHLGKAGQHRSVSPRPGNYGVRHPVHSVITGGTSWHPPGGEQVSEYRVQRRHWWVRKMSPRISTANGAALSISGGNNSS